MAQAVAAAVEITGTLVALLGFTEVVMAAALAYTDKEVPEAAEQEARALAQAEMAVAVAAETTVTVAMVAAIEIRAVCPIKQRAVPVQVDQALCVLFTPEILVNSLQRA